jgi:hypothetical protein
MTVLLTRLLPLDVGKVVVVVVGFNNGLLTNGGVFTFAPPLPYWERM